jgi:hypothetical protein
MDPDPDSECGSGSTDPIESGSNWDPDPQPCLSSVPESLALLDPHPDTVHNLFVQIRIRSLPSTIKKMKTLISTVLRLLHDFLSFWRMMYICRGPSKRKKHKNYFLERFEGHWRKEPDPDPKPDMLVKGTDPSIRILVRSRTKMSRIRKCFFQVVWIRIRIYLAVLDPDPY